MKKGVIVAFIAALALTTIYCGKDAGVKPEGQLAMLCSNCHQKEPGVMRGFLDGIALKSGTIQLDLQSSKEVIKFDKKTVKLENVKNLEDIQNYKTKGFRIDVVEKKGEKWATAIIRFDIMKTIAKMKEIKNIEKAEFKKILADKNAKIFDTRPPAIYKEAHIPGTDVLPAPVFKKFVDKLPKDKNATIVFYCVGGCLSPSAAMQAAELGYKNIKIYAGGFPDWIKTDFAQTSPDWVKEAITKEIPHVMVDTRTAVEATVSHIKGAVNITMANAETWKDKLPKKKNAPIVVYGPEKEKVAAQLNSWGYKKAAILTLPFEKWDGPKGMGPTATVINYIPKLKEGAINLADLKKAAEGDGKYFLVDVRNGDEFEKGTVGKAVNIPVDQLAHRLKELPEGKTAVVFCATGLRSEMAYSTLKKMNIKANWVDATIKFSGAGKYEVNEN